MGKEELVARILSDAEEESRAIIKEAEEKAERVLSAASARAEELKKAARKETDEACAAIRDGRQAAARLAQGRQVLDCFTHTGAFALNAAAARAAHVTAVDVSQFALELAAENGRRNGLTNLDFLCADVFDLLTRMAREKKCDYDYIILDPPAFTKSRATADRAYHGYKEINLKAMRLLPRGGYLATCSCSHFMSDEMFRRMLREAAQDAGVTLRQIEARQQAPDHPILPGVPETDYLKFYLFQLV